MTKKITISDTLTPERVMAAVERAAADTGFTLQRADQTTAVAHDGDKPVTGDVTATRARVGVRVERGRVLLDSQTIGAAYVGAGNSWFMIRIMTRYSKFAKRVKQELRSLS